VPSPKPCQCRFQRQQFARLVGALAHDVDHDTVECTVVVESGDLCWIEAELLDTLEVLGTGCIAFSPLAQGMLTSKYLNGVPADARAAKGGSLNQRLLSDENVVRIRALNDITARRGQTLAQMAIASALIGARRVQQLDDSLDAVNNLAFSAEELAEIDEYATEGAIHLWKVSSNVEELPQR
jgi:L-glyceraldehyde 3-phosphate reductase